MQYKKPKDVRYVDMAIWIDHNAYKEDITEDDDLQLFEYLFHIARMLAVKSGYFRRTEYFDDFGTFFATWMFMRYKNVKQYEIDELTGEPKLEKVRSCLNYMKGVLYARKVEFEQKFYSQAFSPAVQEGEEVEYATNYTFADKLSETIDDINSREFDICLGQVCKTMRAFLKQIPYRYNSIIWNNIYLSCLLTFLNTITLSKRERHRVMNLKKDIQNRPRALNGLYNLEPEKAVILYHLEPSMQDYIWILVQELKHTIAKDLSLTLKTYVPFNSSLNLIALADINLEDFDYYED